jgi:hypothetical protein
MDSHHHNTLVRWATAAVVAASAVLFVSADGYSYTKRLFVNVTASGGSACNNIYGGAYVWNASAGGLLCNVHARATSGTTNSATTICPGAPAFIQPVWNDWSTGQRSGQLWPYTPWGTQTNWSDTTPGGCGIGVNAYGN